MTQDVLLAIRRCKLRCDCHIVRLTFAVKLRPFTQCAVFAGLFDAAKARACTPSKGILVEPTGNKDEVEIPRLPGCNPLC